MYGLFTKETYKNWGGFKIMLYAIWRWIQLWFIPYGWLVKLYKANKALPANIKTRQGRNLRAIMVTTDYGILFTEETYIKNRAKKLKEEQERASRLNDALIQEINALSFQERESLYNSRDDK